MEKVKMHFINSRYNKTYKCKYWLYLVVLSKSYIFAHFVLTAASPSLTTCKCIPLKDCKPYTSFLRHNDPRHGAIFSELITNAACGSANTDFKVCCPTIELAHHHEHPFAEHHHNDGWAWQRFHSGGEPNQNSFENVVDYKDLKTPHNAPHVFYEENHRYNSDRLLREPKNFNYRFNIAHHHHHHHHHDSVEPHLYYGTGSRIGNANAGSSKPIIFPDDARYIAFSKSESNGILQSNPRRIKDSLIFNIDNANFKQQSRAAATKEVDYVASGTSTLEIFQNAADCGKPLNTQLPEGMTPAQGQFPWITRIAYLNTTSQRISYRCSGSVINQIFVLTAAHCVTDLVHDLKLSHVRIGDASSTKDSLTYEISDVIIHPNYDEPKYANDIALLKLIRSPNEGNFTVICLPLDSAFANADRLIDTTGVVAGWSNTNSEVGSGAAVKYLRLPIVNNTQCAITYAKYTENFHVPIVITPAHLCARSTKNMRDVCQGDSGGPFMDDGMSGIANTRGRYTLLGIVAFGPTVCSGTTIPGVYMRVSSFIEWIVLNLH